MRTAFVGLAIAAGVLLGVLGSGPHAPTHVVGAYPPCPPPANDNFANAAVITALPFGDSIASNCATTEAGEGDLPCFGDYTVWYTYTSPISQVITVYMSELSFLNVYTGSSIPALAPLDPPVCESTYLSPESRQFAMFVGETYRIQVGAAEEFQIEAAYPPGIDFSLGIDVDGDDIDDCTTRPAEPTSCVAAPDQLFHLGVYLDALPSNYFDYSTFSATVRSTNLASKHNVDAEPWPDCNFGPFFAFEPGLDNVACANPAMQASSYIGLMATIDYTCTEDGVLKLLHGGETYIDGGFGSRFEAGVDELHVSCDGVAPPPVGGAAFDAPTSSPGALDAWWLAGITGAALVAAGGAALYVRRRG